MYHFLTKHKMYNLIQLLCLLLAVGFTCSWDIAVSTENEIRLMSRNGSLLKKVAGPYRDLRSLSYDSVRDILFFADRQHNASIFALQFGCNEEIEELVQRQPTDNIQQMVFEPVTDELFWTNHIETRGQIHRMQLGNGLADTKMDVIFSSKSRYTISGIAVDSCNGYIYWTNSDHMNPSIERSRLDNFEPETLIDTNLYMPLSIVVDQSSSKLYWIDDKGEATYCIESADLDGKNRKSVYNGTGGSGFVAISVDEENIYWIDSVSEKVWKYPKNSSNNSIRSEVPFEKGIQPKGIASKIDLLDQIDEKKECKNLASLRNSVVNESRKFCLKNVKDSDPKLIPNTHCQSPSQSCDICSNYCLHGTCSLQQGAPTCRCEDGFSGLRCELSCEFGACCLPPARAGASQCQKHSPPAQPECLCPGNSTVSEISNEAKSAVESDTTTRCSTTREARAESDDEANAPGQAVEESMRSDDGCLCIWVQLSQPLVMSLLALCGALSLACAALAAKLMQLNKRPRIKKRYIVNKNVTPLTCRPEAGQCEITIENCCNMNICETPCFEPQGLRSASVPSGKEEKRNLIAHMEHPDDLY